MSEINRFALTLCACIMAACLLTHPAKAQRANTQIDVGFHAGANSYTGDLNLSPIPNTVRFAVGGDMRYNLGEYYALHARLQGGMYTAQFKPGRFFFPDSIPNPINRLFIGFDMAMEIHLLPFEVNDFNSHRNQPKWIAPYATLGMGVGYIAPSAIAFYIPMGFGVKFAVGSRWTLAPEVRFLKYFSDITEEVRDWPAGGGIVIHNSDWQAQALFTVTYRLITNRTSCPVYQ